MSKHYDVSLDQENLAPGAEVQVHGLGTLVNGKTVSFSQEQVETHFRLMNSTQEETRSKKGKLIAVEEVVGQTLKQAAEYMNGVTVEGPIDDPESAADKKAREDKEAADKKAAEEKKEGDKK